MCKLYSKVNPEKIYNVISGNNYVQSLNGADLCEMMLIPDDFTDKVIEYKFKYKEFLLIVSANIIVINGFKYIEFYRGTITSDIKDKARIKNLLYKLRKTSVHGGWVINNNKMLSFDCNYYDDIFLINKGFNISSKEDDIISFKTKEWVFNQLINIVDTKY